MEPKWLELAREELGTKESPGTKNNPVVVQYYADSGNAGIRDDSVAWCAAFVGAMLRRCDLPSTGTLTARDYLKYGTPLDEPKLGCIVVFTRGNSTWEGHVAFYVGETANNIKVLGGNQSNSVSIASYPKSKLLGYRWPVEPTVPALRAAGSTEIKDSDDLMKLVVVPPAIGATVKAADDIGIIDGIKNVSEGMGVFQHAMEGVSSVLKAASSGIVVVVIVSAIAGYFIVRRIRRKRAQRAMAGQPLSVQA